VLPIPQNRKDNGSSMSAATRNVTAGVDTHSRTHHAAVLDEVGRELADREFPATAPGYRALLAWLRTFGVLVAAGVEGTGSYGAGLTRFLTGVGVTVIEVDRPDRKARRVAGKSDPLDAYSAARAILAGRATGVPKTGTGIVESIRILRIVRHSAVKARTAALNEFGALLLTAPEAFRETMRPLTRGQKLRRATAMRPDTTQIAEPTQAIKTALRRLAQRITTLDTEIKDANRDLGELTRTAAPTLSAVFGVGPDVSGQLLITAGDNPDRLRNEAAFAHLTGVAPIPASSGNTQRHRLNRGGDRQANSALYRTVIVRMRHHQPTRDYVERRTKEGLSAREIIRCLNRALISEIYTALMTDFAAITT
jgi:transposase